VRTTGVGTYWEAIEIETPSEVKVLQVGNRVANFLVHRHLDLKGGGELTLSSFHKEIQLLVKVDFDFGEAIVPGVAL
jgi:hypothetical protein